MRHTFPREWFGALGVLLLWSATTGCLLAQAPGKGKGPKGPPPNAEFLTVHGTVKEFTTAPKGEVDGFILNDGTWVHWPPHLENRFTGIAKGDRVKVVGFQETGPKGDTKLEVATLTNFRTNKTIENPDRPLPGVAGNVEDRLQALEERVEQILKEIKSLRAKK